MAEGNGQGSLEELGKVARCGAARGLFGIRQDGVLRGNAGREELPVNPCLRPSVSRKSRPHGVLVQTKAMAMAVGRGGMV